MSPPSRLQSQIRTSSLLVPSCFVFFSCFEPWHRCRGSDAAQLCCGTNKIPAFIPLAEFDRRLAATNPLTHVHAGGDAIGTDWHDQPMVLSHPESPTAHRLAGTRA